MFIILIEFMKSDMNEYVLKHNNSKYMSDPYQIYVLSIILCVLLVLIMCNIENWSRSFAERWNMSSVKR